MCVRIYISSSSVKANEQIRKRMRVYGLENEEWELKKREIRHPRTYVYVFGYPTSVLDCIYILDEHITINTTSSSYLLLGLCTELYMVCVGKKTRIKCHSRGVNVNV